LGAPCKGGDSPAYLAPELVAGHEPTAAADVCSFGVEPLNIRPSSGIYINSSGIYVHQDPKSLIS